MTVEQLISAYPRLYHMAEDGSWPSIQRHGLLSTLALLELFDIAEPMRTSLFSAHRPESVSIHHATHGEAVIRDQKPMAPNRLAACLLDGLTTTEWYEIINRRVFFWLTEKRLITLLSARAYRNRAHTVLTVDTAALVNAAQDRILLTPINSGNTFPIARPRGRATFTTIGDYPFEKMKRKRGKANAVVELSVESAVPNILEYVRRVERRQADTVLTVLLG